MKKFLKVFVIVLLVLAVIGGTVYFFFWKNKKEKAQTVALIDYLSSESKRNLYQKLTYIDSNIISKDDGKTDNRLDVLIETNVKLDEIMYVLISYHAESEMVIGNKDLKNQLDEINAKRSEVLWMIEEYYVKSGYFINENGEVEFKETNFDEHEGLNDLYCNMCSYLVEYAHAVNSINNSLEVNRASDLKFNMFEIYSNIVINTFALFDEGDWIGIKDQSNINKINSMLKIRDLNIVKLTNEGNSDEKVELLFTINNNEFNSFYNKCNKKLFAENFNAYMSSSSETTNEEIASKYLKLAYGI